MGPVALDPSQIAAADFALVYPALAERWVIHCTACDRAGHRVEMPDGERGARALKRSLAPLPVDAAGLCVACTPASPVA